MDGLLSLGKFYQMGFVTRDIDAAIAQATEELGAQLTRVSRDLKEDGRDSVVKNVALLKLGGIDWELIEPRLEWPSSIYLDALPNGPAAVTLHHYGFLVEETKDFDLTMERVEKARLSVPFAGTMPTVRFAYIDTRPITGHYSEIVQYLTPT
jgi:hypothetical protein